MAAHEKRVKIVRRLAWRLPMVDLVKDRGEGPKSGNASMAVSFISLWSTPPLPTGKQTR